MAKRLFDIFASFCGILLLAPLFVVISIVVMLDSPGPVLFRQQRVGRHGRIFHIRKYRTMYQNSESQGQLTIGTDRRVTRSGMFLRKYKLDELPQLIDVFVGNMSIVGPRPEVPEFVAYYSDANAARILSIRPGITDLASIEMIDENEILAKYEDPKQAYINVILPMKQRYYIDYALNNSFWGDIGIIFLTLKKIVRRS